MHQTCSLHAGHTVFTHLQEGHHIALQGGFWVLPRQQGVVYALLCLTQRVSDGRGLRGRLCMCAPAGCMKQACCLGKIGA